ncbi:hypothetical protein ACHAWO_010922 [Cyclotella atomus]|uniref:Kazal-like domain-containing protein n=1 Tax=Cyclotella atomus TaxID=382360 RepID=A0ABD3PSD2_9STRA
MRRLTNETFGRLKWQGKSNAPLDFSHRQVKSCKTNADCPRRFLCKLPDGDCVNKRKRDLEGHCEELNFFCTRIYRPVCGCDDRTYSNACVCNSKGVNIAFGGYC